MKKTTIAALLAVLTMVACADVGGTRDIPSPYRAEIETLNQDNLELDKKAQDLRKQLTELTNEEAWNNSRIENIAARALHSIGYSPQEYVIDVAKMKIVKRDPHLESAPGDCYPWDKACRDAKK
jgi:hypothetical protein